MRATSLVLAFVLTSVQAFAQEPPSINQSIARAAKAVAAEEQASRTHSGTLMWSGLALGVAGVTTAVLGLTAFKVEDSSTGNAPPGAYQACVAQKANPIYATNQCDLLKAKNLKLLTTGAVLGGVGAALMIGSAHTSAEISPGVVRFLHRIRF
jgi:hypothetical protein